MKSTKIVSCLIIGFVFFAVSSCKDGYRNLGSASAELNGISWDPNFVRGNNSDSFDGAILMEISIKDDDGYDTELISLRGVKLEEGNYPLKYDLEGDRVDSVFCAYYTVEQQGEILADVYHPVKDPTEPNYIEITSYRKGSKTIEGTFEFTLVIENDSVRWYGIADTLRFRNGVFETRIAD